MNFYYLAEAQVQNRAIYCGTEFLIIIVIQKKGANNNRIHKKSKIKKKLHYQI